MKRRNANRKRLGVRGRWIVAATMLAITSLAHAPPQGVIVINGTVTITQNGNVWTIQCSDGAIIQCTSFDILAHELVQFLQPGAAARVLNYISGGMPTQIQGTLLANGIVFFVNPAGVIFGNGAVVDVGGIYAAAANLENPAGQVDIGLAQGAMNPSGSVFEDVTGEVINHGLIQAQIVHLIGQHVANYGTIQVEAGGVLTMAAGDMVMITPMIGNHVSVTIPLSQNQGQYGVVNEGVINGAAGSQVVLGAGDMYSLAIRQAGSITAGQATMFADGDSGAGGTGGGTILLEGLQVGDGVTTSGDQVYDGDVEVDGDVSLTSTAGDVEFQGTVDSAGAAANLEVTAGETRFDGHVGQTRQLTSLVVTGDATAAGNVLASDGIAVTGDLGLVGAAGAAQTVDAGAGALTVLGSVARASTGSVTLGGEGFVDVGGDVTVANGNLTFQDDAFVDGNVQSAVGAVAFDETSDVGGSVSAGTTATFSGAAAIDGSVAAIGDVTFQDAGNVGGNVVSIAGAVAFDATSDVGGFVLAGTTATFTGDAEIDGNVTAKGDVSFLANAEVGGDVKSTLAAVAFAGIANVDGDVSAKLDVTFQGTADVGGDVTSTTAAVAFGGTSDVDGSVTAATTATFTGIADIDGDVLAGSQVLFMQTAHLGGDVTGQGVHFLGNAFLDGAGNQRIDAGTSLLDADMSIDKTTAGKLDLAGDAGIDVFQNVTAANGDLTLHDAAAIGGNVQSTLAAVAFAGTSDVGGSVTAGTTATFTGDADIDGSVVAHDDVTFQSTADIGGNVQSTHAAVAFAGTSEVDGSVSAGTTATFTGAADIGGSVVALGNVTFGSTAAVSGDVQSTNAAVAFAGTSEVGGSVTAGTTATFTGAAGIGGSVVAHDDVTFQSTADIGGNVQSTHAAVAFAGTSDVDGSVTAGTTATFTGAAGIGGSVVAHDDVTFQSTADIGGNVQSTHAAVAFAGTSDVGGSVTAGTTATFTGAAGIGGSVVAHDEVTFQSTADIGGNVQSTHAAVAFAGTSDVDGSVTAGTTATFTGAADIGGSVTAGGMVTFDQTAKLGGNVSGQGVDFHGAVTLANNIIISARDEGILFGSTVDSDGTARGLTVVTTNGGDVTFSQDVGVSKRLKYLTTKVGVGGVLFLGEGEDALMGLPAHGITIKAVDEVSLNDGIFAYNEVPVTATIGAYGDLLIDAGTISIGQSQKLTADGSVNLLSGGDVFLSDINAKNDLIVSAGGGIYIRSRAPGEVQSSQGSLASDQGVDFVIGGSYSFNKRPEMIDGYVGTVAFRGPNAQFANPAATAPLELNGFIIRAFGPGGDDPLISNSTFLDLRAQGPSNTNPSTALAGALPLASNLEEVRPSASLGADTLKQLAAAFRIDGRQPDEDELHQIPLGTIVIDDTRSASLLAAAPAGDEEDAAGPLVTLPRILKLMADSSLEARKTLTAEGPEAVRRELEPAWDDYQRTPGAEGNPAGFAAFLEQTADAEGHENAREHLQNLKKLHGDLRAIGLTDEELAVPFELIIGDFKPRNMTREEFEQAIEGVGPGGAGQ